MKPKYPKIKQAIRHSTKSYGWDNGDIAFGNPLDSIAKNDKKKARSKVRWHETKKLSGDVDSRTKFHRMHG